MFSHPHCLSKSCARIGAWCATPKKETKSLMAHLIVNIEPELIENFDRPAFSNLGDAA